MFLRGLFMISVICLGVSSHAQVFDQIPEQETFDIGFLGSSMGIAIPFGEFKRTDYQSLYAGYAEIGYQNQIIDFSKKFSKHFAVGVDWHRSVFGFDEQAYIHPYEDFNREYTFTIETEDNWVIHSALGNAVLNVPSKILDVDIRLGLGLGRVSRPKIQITANSIQTGYLAAYWAEDTETAYDLIVGAGANFRFHVYRGIDLFFSADYQRMNADLAIEIRDHFESVTEERDQNIEMLQLGAGVGFTLK